MKTYACVDCGTVGDAPAYGVRKRCDDCQKIDQRERLRRSRARHRVVPTFTCVDCGATGEGRSDRKRCDECRAEHDQTYHRVYNAENDPYTFKPERTWTCVGCGVVGTQPAKGNPRTRCDDCTREIKAERMRSRLDAGPTPCLDCGVLVPRSGGSRRRPHKRCPECNLKSKTGVRRARKNGPGREYFKPVEIFERDGWVCYLCGLTVDPEMRYPDPRSASLDHVHPLSAGGPHSRANTACTHLECNVRKHAKIIQMEENDHGDQ